MSDAAARIPLVRPSLPARDELEPFLEEIWRSGVVTTGRFTREFEEAVAEAAGVRDAVMVNHGTTALMLAARALGLEGEVIVPSFSWTATAGALVWNGVEPVFADVTPGRLTLDPAAVEAAVTPRTRAIMPVNVFGVPPDVRAFEALSERLGLPILYDSAQGLGSRVDGRVVGGFGAAECFSLSPTKVVTGVEGGLVTTDDPQLAARVRSMRDSGKNPEGTDIVRLGLSGRPSELHAAVALTTFRKRETLIRARLERIEWYRSALDGLAGLQFQEVPQEVASTGNYFVVFIDPAAAPLGRDDLATALEAQGIQTKRYFHPAIHRQRAYAHLRDRYEGRLPVTETASERGLALPLFGDMARADVDRVAAALRQSYAAAAEAGERGRG